MKPLSRTVKLLLFLICISLPVQGASVRQLAAAIDPKGGIHSIQNRHSIISPRTGAVNRQALAPVFRLYNTVSGTYFYTLSDSERTAALNRSPHYRDEGVGFYAYTTQEPGSLPVHRFYNTAVQGHFYTLSEEEKNAVRHYPAFHYEGIAYYAYMSPLKGTKPVYRFYDIETQSHFYTSSDSERADLIENRPGYHYEGIVFHVPDPGATDAGITFAVFSDPHFYDSDLGTTGEAFEGYLAWDRKLLRESEAIVAAAVDRILSEGVDFVIVPGDLTKDGELTGHQKFAAYMKVFKQRGIRVYVIPGNHDVNNPHALSYSGAFTAPVQSVTPEDFAEVYRDSGYGEVLDRDPHSLSYVAEPVEGVWVLGMDACLYRENTDHPVTGGRFSQATLDWITGKLTQAGQLGKTVIGFMHHGLLEHHIGQSDVFGDYLVQDWRDVSKTLADAGLRMVFTGHYHAQDITSASWGDSFLYDIETGSLVTYPIPYRVVTLSKENKVAIRSEFIRKVDYDTGDLTFREYAESGLEEGISFIVTYGLTLPADQGGFGLPPVMARLIVPQIVNALKAHYAGDETPDPETLTMIDSYLRNPNPTIRTLGQVLHALWTDLPPADNTLTLDLKAFTRPRPKSLRIKVVETTDVHGSIFPYDFIENRVTGTSLAQVHSYVKALRDREEVILVDNGDLLQGQPVVHYYNFEKDPAKEPHLLADVMNYMQYDAAVVGNHDIEAGHEVYDALVRQFDFPWLSANIIRTSTGKSYFKPYTILHRQGVTVALLGLTTPYIPQWLPESLRTDMDFQDMVQSARQWVTYIRENETPDVLIGVFHSGFDYTYGGQDADTERNENASQLVAEKVPGFDLILIGHDHQERNEVVNGVRILGGKPYARTAPTATITLTWNEEKQAYDKAVEAESTDMSLYGPDAGFMEQFADAFQEVKGYVDAHVGDLTRSITTRESMFGDSPFVDLIHRLQFEVAEKELGARADISFAAPLFFDKTVEAGPVYVRDMFKLYPYENLLCTMRLSGREIKDFLEYSYGNWLNRMSDSGDHLLNFKFYDDTTGKYDLATRYYNYDSAAGIRYTVNVSKPQGERIFIESMEDGTPFDLLKEYVVALNSYRSNGGGGHLRKGAKIPEEEIPRRRIASTDRDLRYHLIKWIEEQGAVTPEAFSNWKIVPEAWANGGKAKDYRILYRESYSAQGKVVRLRHREEAIQDETCNRKYASGC